MQRAHIRVPRAERRRGAADGGQPVRDQVRQLLLRRRRPRHAQQGRLQLQRRPQVMTIMTTTTTQDGLFAVKEEMNWSEVVRCHVM